MALQELTDTCSGDVGSFRGDSRWMGLSKLPGQDVFLGLCASGNLYVAR
jgi:hypothetical protein